MKHVLPRIGKYPERRYMLRVLIFTILRIPNVNIILLHIMYSINEHVPINVPLEGDFELTHSIILLIKKQIICFYLRYRAIDFLVISTVPYSSKETKGIIKTSRIHSIVSAETRTIHNPYYLK